jgi:PAS domain S-box-containing protein
MTDTTVFYKNVLDNMSDGVMTLGLKGQIIMFNPAASNILGMLPEEVLNRPFAEVFMMEMEGNDEFNQAILDAIYQSDVGRNITVEFQRKDGSVVTLSMTSSYLSSGERESSKHAGVIVVFSDITEVKKLQDAEKELNRKLRGAYLEVEESNKNLQSALKKVQVIRMAVTLFVILLFVGLGLYSWNPSILKKISMPTGADSRTSEDRQFQTYTVIPQPLSSSISLSGNIEPLSEVNVVSPFQGKIRERYFDYGQLVQKGQRLLLMDTSEMEIKLRESRSAYIKARSTLQELEKWDKSTEVIRAKRTFAGAENKLKETKLLYEKGIVARNEYGTAQEQLINQKEELDNVLKKGSPGNVRIARLEFKNAESRLLEMENQLKEAIVTAPVRGIVILPVSQQSNKNKVIEKGVSVSQGDLLLSIGNLGGLTVKSRVDEVDIGKISIGQTVTVSGDAFINQPLSGIITHISSQANANSSMSTIPMFDVHVTATSLTPGQKKMIKLGMSANLQVHVYNNPKALLVPIEAVRTMDKKHFLTVKDRETGVLKDREIETGLTTLDSVEVTQGLSSGDTVVLQQGSDYYRMPDSSERQKDNIGGKPIKYF